MKNLFFVSVAFSIFSGTSLTATAQQSINFIDGIEFTQSPEFASSTPVKGPSIRPMLRSRDELIPVSTEMCTSLQFKYSQLLDREVESISNIPLFEFIDDWYGTRYRYGGTTKKGVDCSSLTGQLLQKVYGLEVPRTAREQYNLAEKIKKDELSEGDLVFFNTRGGISHVGLFLGDGYFVHASSSSGVTISNLEDAYFKKRYIGAGRITNTPIPDNMAKVIL